MYRIALCDDSRRDRQVLLVLLEKILHEEGIDFSVTEFDSAGAVLERHDAEENWNLLILDIMMNEKSGIELAEELRGLGDKTDIIFVTSSPEFALAGYHTWPVSYLLKPVAESEFQEVMKRCLEKIIREPPIIFDLKRGGQREMESKDIFYIEVFGEELVVHGETDSFSCRGRMKEIDAALNPAAFFRCHRCYIVNLGCVNRIKRYEFTLLNDETIPISKGNWKEAQRLWINYYVSAGR